MIHAIHKSHKMVEFLVNVERARQRRLLVPPYLWKVVERTLNESDQESEEVIVWFVLPPEILDKGKPDVVFDYIQWVLGCQNSSLPILSPVPSDRGWTKKVWQVFDDFACGWYGEYPETPWTSVLASCSMELYQGAMLDWMMRRSVFAGKDPIDPYIFLLKPKQVRRMPKLDPIDRSNAGVVHASTMLPKHAAELEEPDFDRICKYCAALKKEIPDMPWLAAAGEPGSGLVVAGGCLVAALYGKDLKDSQDVDLFLVSASRNEHVALADGERVAQRAVDAICEAFGKKNMRVVTTYNSNVTNVFVYDSVTVSNGVYRFTSYKRIHKFQIIRTVYPTPSHIVHGFDVDVCGILWDGAKIFYTQNAARAVVNGFVLYDENKLSTTAESRYAKYALRYGLGILVVGAPQRKVNCVLQTISKFSNKKAFLVNCLTQWQVSVKDSFHRIVSEDVECPRALEKAITGRKRHDLFGILHHMLKQTYTPQAGVSDYDDRTLSIVRNNALNRKPEYRLARDGKRGVFTGAFNPVEADTLAGLADIYGS